MPVNNLLHFSFSLPIGQILWTFSIYLEAVAILPQLHVITKTGEAETITAHYLFALGSYRALYIINWIYRYVTDDTYDIISIAAGTIQTILYVDFFYLYVTRGKFGSDIFPDVYALTRLPSDYLTEN